MSITLEMTYKKSTKNTHVFEADFEGSEIPTLYIKRDAMPDGDAPSTITVSVEWSE